MKSLYALLLLSLSCICHAQTKGLIKNGTFVLHGKLKGRATGFIVLIYPDTSEKYKRDTAYIENGSFTFTGKVNQPSFAHLIGSPKDGNRLSFFLEAGNLQVMLTEDDCSNAKVQGSKTQDEYAVLLGKQKHLQQTIQQLENEKNQLTRTSKNEKDTIRQKGLQKKVDELNSVVAPMLRQMMDMDIVFIIRHPHSYASPTLLYGIMYSPRFSALPADSAVLLYAAFDAFTPEIKKSRVGQLCAALIAKQTGHAAPDFAVSDINGRPLILSSFKGKYVLIDFWASWCIPCRESTPYLKELFNKYHDKGLEVIGIADDDKNPLAWRKAVKKDGVDIWHNALSGLRITEKERNRTNDINDKYGVQAIPAIILIDKEGKIIGRYTGAEKDKDLEQKLAEIFDH